MRPVYEVLGFYNVLYLFYTGEAWEVADDWIGHYAQRHVVFRVVDTALRPEYIISRWELNVNGTFVPAPKLRLRCRGNPAAPEGACVQNYPCFNNARCQYVSRTRNAGEIMCLCGAAHQGRMCSEDTPACAKQNDIEKPEHALIFSSNGHRLGDITTYFCSPDSAEMFFFAKCENKKSDNGTANTEWVHHGNCDLYNSATGASLSQFFLASLLVLTTLLIH